MCQKKHPYTVDQALTSLAGTSRRLQRLSERISPKQASARPAPDKWSAKEIICHLADCELVYGVRYRKIVAERKPSLVPFDQNEWASKLQYRRQPLKGSLATFLALRAGNLAMFKALPKSAWNKKGRHPDYGALSLKQLVVHIADHDRNHVAQVERLTR
jgi:uncharacterized damage-inducible protein DinB